MPNDIPLILLTNDDGILSPGLAAAALALCELGEVLVVAPADQQTGMGRSLPSVAGGEIRAETLAIDSRRLTAYSITSSPAQAVDFGALTLAPRRPSLIVAGINHGENLGSSVTSSGTVGAALHGASLGIPSLAVSLETDSADHLTHNHSLDWSAAAHFTALFAGLLLNAQLPFDVDVLKVDVPATATRETPWRLTRQSRQPYYITLPPAGSPLEDGLTDLGYGVAVDWDTLEPDSDIYALAHDRVVSVTPLSQDLTSRVNRESLDQLLRAPSRSHGT